MGLFGKNYNKVLDEALSDFEKGDFQTCYQKVCQSADAGVGRAYFCKALLCFNDSINPGSEVDLNVLESLLKKAVDADYPLAYGFYATVLEERGKTEELCDFCKQKSKVKDGWYLWKKSAYYFGLFTDNESQASDALTRETMLQAVENLRVAVEEAKNKKGAYYEYKLYSPFGGFSPERLYAKANFHLLTGYYCFGDSSDRKAFMQTFETALSYMPITSELLRMIRLYSLAIFKNYLGMRDFNEGQRAIRMFADVYNRLDEDTKKLYEEDYDDLFEKYEAFYDEEKERLDAREVAYFDGNESQNFFTAENLKSAFSSFAQNLGNSSQETATTTYYPIDNKKYVKGDDGYLYDSDGFKSGYRIDDVGRLYDRNDRELGYYNYKGLFISSK